MKKIIYFTLLLIIACSSKKDQEVFLASQSNLHQPYKLMLNYKSIDSSYIYICFPKKINFINQTPYIAQITNITIGKSPRGTSTRDYKVFSFIDKLESKHNIIDQKISQNENRSFNIYYSYLLKISNKKLDSLINNSEEIQKYQRFPVYNINLAKKDKEWVSKTILNKYKGQLHFSLHNKEKGFFYKSLDIELFED